MLKVNSYIYNIPCNSISFKKNRKSIKQSTKCITEKNASFDINERLISDESGNGFVNENFSNTNTLLYSNTSPIQKQIQEYINDTPQFFKIIDDTNEKTNLPVMLYFSGMDGSVASIYKQLPTLIKNYDFRIFIISKEDRTDFNGLIDIINAYIKNEIKPISDEGRPVHVMGESLGALLACKTAHDLKNVIDRVILINPATSYDNSIWSRLVPLIETMPMGANNLIPLGLMPLLGNPIQMALNGVNLTSPLENPFNIVLNNINDLIGNASYLEAFSDKEYFLWKLKLVEDGCKKVNKILYKLQQRTLGIFSTGDWLLPSQDEAKRLEKMIKRLVAIELENRSHAVLLEANIDLFQIIKDEGFYITERRLSSKKAWKGSMLNNFSTPGPVELPSERELKRTDDFTSRFRDNFSPIFLSTTEDGKIVRGLSGIPEKRPILLIGNHQLLAPDTFLLIDEFIKKEGILVRGLTIPSLVKDIKGDELGDKFLLVEGGADPRIINSALTTYGGVANGSKNLHDLLSQDEIVLLYPGGVREAYKNKEELYKLIWPSRTEFIRSAAKFGATIITVASVGADDSFNILINNEEAIKLPVIGNMIKNQSERIPSPRRGIALDTENEHLFFQPIGIPGIPSRIYSLFGKHFDTTGIDYKNKDDCQRLYQEVKSNLESDIAFLLKKREEDLYKDFLPRTIYERTWNGKQAPTFDI